MPATFHEQEVAARLKDRRALSAFLDKLVKERLPHIRKVKLTYIFCTDAYLHSMNVQYLDHDTLTDIITFDMSEVDNEVTGEIYVSTERVADNAASFKTTYDRELHRVIFHGALHLCGLGDKSVAEGKAMRKAEDATLDAWYATKQQ